MNLEKIKAALASLLVEASNTMSDKGNIFYDGENLIEGMQVYSDEELTTPLSDGEYVTDENIIVVADGRVAEIKEKTEEPETEEVEEVTAEEEVEEEVTETVKEEVTEEGDDLKAEIEALKAEIEALKGTIAEILTKVNEPATSPVTEEFAAISDVNDWSNIRKVARQFGSRK